MTDPIALRDPYRFAPYRFARMFLPIVVLLPMVSAAKDDLSEWNGSVEMDRANKALLNSLFERLISWESEKGFPKSRPLGQHVRTSSVSYYELKYRTIPKYIYSSEVYADIDPLNAKIMRLVRLPPPEPLDHLRKPIWSPDKAIDRAREVTRLVIGELPAGLGPPTAEFFNQRNGTVVSENAYWRMFWPRATRDGYLWQSEGITVQISEETGLVSFHDKRWTTLEEPAAGKRPKPGEEFDAIALDYAKKTIENAPLFRSERGRVEIKGRVSRKLKVIYPNSFMTAQTFDEVWEPIKLAAKAAIAYVFVFELGAPDKSRSGSSLLVYIDPFTGEYLGGDSG